MMTNKRGGRRAEPINWPRAIALATSIVVVIYGGYSVWRNLFDPPGVDFVSFWAAGRLALGGGASLAYDIATHRAMELTTGNVFGLLPFPYPPPFLFVVTPFALFPFVVAFPLWLIATGIFYLLAVRPFIAPQYAFAVPAALPNALIGQNAFFTTGLLALGLHLLAARPFAAGAVLGLMAMKPQLALLLPIALLAGRQWRAIVGAAVSSVAIFALAALVFGLSAYEGFIRILPEYAAFMRDSRLPWTELASPFAGLRHLGIGAGAAMAVHLMVAAAAVAVTFRAWWSQSPLRAEILASASVLVPPYLFTYDSLLLALPLGWMMRTGRLGAAALVWGLCLLPIAGLARIYAGPNTVPLAAIACLVFAVAARRGSPCSAASRELDQAPSST